MCRLFGCSVTEEEKNVFYLKDISDRLHILSEKHADGWGVAYYYDGIPHVMRSERRARECKMFSKMAPQIRSHMMLVHLRKATIGKVDVLNTHPFQHGKWVFAHNGHIACPKGEHVCLEDEIHPSLKHLILGETDSEQLFYMFMGSLKKYEKTSNIVTNDMLVQACTDFVRQVRHRVGPFEPNPTKIGSTFLSFLISDGKRLIAFQGGQELFWQEGVGVSVMSDPVHEKQAWQAMQFGELMIIEQGVLSHLEKISVELT
ncbi:MAG: class II glutamine amidotransferase [Oligoflexales bacterium]